VSEQIPSDVRRILDIGCGSGDTARLIKARLPGVWIEGITYNTMEAMAASSVVDRVHVFDIETELPSLLPMEFDCLLFSHILEHVRDPPAVVCKFLTRLVRNRGIVVVAVPNVLEWRTRMRFLRGDWQYEDAGILDRTHLRFITFLSAERELLGDPPPSDLTLVCKTGDGAVPMGPLRKLRAPRSLVRLADRWGVRNYPNLFAQQIVLIARKTG